MWWSLFDHEFLRILVQTYKQGSTGCIVNKWMGGCKWIRECAHKGHGSEDNNHFLLPLNKSLLFFFKPLGPFKRFHREGHIRLMRSMSFFFFLSITCSSCICEFSSTSAVSPLFHTFLVQWWYENATQNRYKNGPGPKGKSTFYMHANNHSINGLQMQNQP